MFYKREGRCKITMLTNIIDIKNLKNQSLPDHEMDSHKFKDAYQGVLVQYADL